MVEAYVLIKCEKGKVSSCLKSISKIANVKEAKAVTGPYDIIAFVTEKDLNSIGKVVINKIQAVSGIKDTLSCVVVEI